jgi:hypothetical protein
MDWTFHAGDFVVLLSFLVSLWAFRMDQNRKHGENISRMAKIEERVEQLMTFMQHWIRSKMEGN